MQPPFPTGSTVITAVPLVSGFRQSILTAARNTAKTAKSISVISLQILLSLQDTVQEKNPAQEHRCLPYSFAFHQLPFSALLPQASCLWEIRCRF